MTLEAAKIAALLRTARYGRSLDVRARTTSTNDDARHAAERGAPDGHVVVADAQDAGRGAHGHSWESPAGVDLYLSIVARPRLALAELPLITLATGLGVHDCVTTELRGTAVTLKWPNDVLVAGRKCAGILVETSSTGSEVSAVVIGIGLNVNRRALPPELADVATSLALARGMEMEREAVLASLLSAVERRVDELTRDGPPATVRAVDTRLAWRGEHVQCGEARGSLRGVDASGSLLLADDDGRMTAIRSGTLRRA